MKDHFLFVFQLHYILIWGVKWHCLLTKAKSSYSIAQTALCLKGLEVTSGTAVPMALQNIQVHLKKLEYHERDLFFYNSKSETFIYSRFITHCYISEAFIVLKEYFTWNCELWPIFYSLLTEWKENRVSSVKLYFTEETLFSPPSANTMEAWSGHVMKHRKTKELKRNMLP